MSGNTSLGDANIDKLSSQLVDRVKQSVFDKLRPQAEAEGLVADRKSVASEPPAKKEKEPALKERRAVTPCREFASSGYCSWGNRCRFSHDGAADSGSVSQGSPSRRSKGKSSKGGAKGSKGEKGEASKRYRDGSEKALPEGVGNSAHRLIYPRPGTFQYSQSSRAFSYSECQKCLVERFGWTYQQCEGMCFEVGADAEGGAAKCPTPTRNGHLRGDDWAHKFPEGYAKELRNNKSPRGS